MNKKRLNQFLIPLLYHFVCIGVWAETLPDHTQEWQTVYEEKFDQVGNDELPDDFFVLDGEFKVTSKDGRKCLAMSGTPVGEHGFLLDHDSQLKALSFLFPAWEDLRAEGIMFLPEP